MTKNLVLSRRELPRSPGKHQSRGLASGNVDPARRTDSTEDKSRFTQTDEIIGARRSAGVSGRC